MEDKKITEKESLEIISRMIKNTQQNLEADRGMPFLIWGYTTVLMTLIVGIGFSQIIDYRWNYLWFMIPIIGWSLMIRLIKKNPIKVKTYIDTAIMKLWIATGIGQIIVALAAFTTQIPVLFIVLLTIGISTTATGLIIRFKPISIGGFISIMLSISLLHFERSMESLFIFGLAFIVTMIIPGHILNHLGNKHLKK